MEVRQIPKWTCPKPTLHQCILDLCELFQQGAFVTQKFKDSVKASFISTGCSPNSNGSFQQYKANLTKGSFKIVPTGTVEAKEFTKDANYVDLVNVIDGDDNLSDDDE